MRTLIPTLLFRPTLILSIASCAVGANYNYITNEAESGTFTSPMTNYMASVASGGRYVWIPPTAQHTIKDGKAEYDIEITNAPANDTYVVWCRVRAPNANQDSFLVSVDDFGDQIYDVVLFEGTTSRDWQWTRLNGRESPFPRTFMLTNGFHTISFGGRNDGNPPESRTGLDRFIITNDSDFDPNAPVFRVDFAYVEREAETADRITLPMRIEPDPPASGGGYMWLPSHLKGDPNPLGLASYQVDIPLGSNYVIWCRVRAPSGDQDSFHVSVSDTNGGVVLPQDVFDFYCTNAVPSCTNVVPSDYWWWIRVNGRDGTDVPKTIDPKKFNVVVEGSYRIDFGGREAYTALDRFIITDDPDFRPETPPIISLARTNETNTLSWSSNIGTTYSLEYKSSLNQPAWSDVGIITADTNPTTMTNVSMEAQGFYRVRVLPEHLGDSL